MATQLDIELGPVEIADKPAHVPSELVRNLDWAQGRCPVQFKEPYRETERLLTPDMPRVMWVADSIAGKPGVGAWVVTHYEDIAKIYQDSTVFSTEGVAAFQWMIGEMWPSIPLGIDAPDHMKYRAMLNPYFSPKAIDALEPKIRRSANDLIDSFIDRGEVDYAYDFARVYPVRVFMDLMGFPRPMFEQFLDWEFAILHSNSFEQATEALRGIIAYLREFIAERRAQPGGDLADKIIAGQVAGRPMTDDEVLGTIWFLWLGGLDTVASTLAMMFRRLGMDPDLRARLRADYALLPDAVEEFLRTQPLVNSQRMLKQDYELHGVKMSKGDWVMCLTTVGNFDPAEFGCPRDFDLSRDSNRHFTFAGGAHRCLGSHLARRELRVALEEWFDRIPDFEIKPGSDTSVYPGLRSARHVTLRWDASAKA